MIRFSEYSNLLGLSVGLIVCSCVFSPVLTICQVSVQRFSLWLEAELGMNVKVLGFKDPVIVL